LKTQEQTMRFEKRRFGIGLLSAGLALGTVGFAFGEDKPATGGGDTPPPAGERQNRPEGRPEGGPDGRRMEPGRMLDRIQEVYGRLNLSEEQKTKVKSIVDGAKKDVAAAMKEVEGKEPRERMEKMREVLQPVREKLMDVLDETQREKLREEFRNAGGPGGGRFGGPQAEGQPPREASDRPDGARRGRGGPDGAGGPDGQRRQRDPGEAIKRLRDNLPELKLSDEQKQKVDSLLSETEKKLTDLRTEAEKQAQETRTKFREAFESNKQKLDSILTDEQKKKLEELLPAPRGGGGDGERRGDRPGRGEPRPEGQNGGAKPKE
jgi:Spy/CpxP family protein refolding chaperone